MNRLEFIFKSVNEIASKKHDATTEYMLAEAVLNEIDVAKRERKAKSNSAASGNGQRSAFALFAAGSAV